MQQEEEDFVVETLNDAKRLYDNRNVDLEIMDSGDSPCRRFITVGRMRCFVSCDWIFAQL